MYLVREVMYCKPGKVRPMVEMEVPSLQAFEQMMSNPRGSPEDLKQMEELMKGYHDLVERGKREICKVEG